MTTYAVFVPAYNCEPYLERCLDSVLMQQKFSGHFRVSMVNDASTDGTGKIMDRYYSTFWAAGIHAEVHTNEENLKMPHNLVEHGREGNGDDVIVILDGDDFFPNDMCLYRLDTHYYLNSRLWLTYGSYLNFPDPYKVSAQAMPYDPEVIEHLSFRRVAPRYNHPITFRRHLLNEIEDWELQFNDGSWYDAAYDHALMMPMLELASRGHFKWVPDFIYAYNEENPLSEVHTSDHGDLVHSSVNHHPVREPLF